MDDWPWTHSGWLGICPIYLADIESDEPHVEPRHWVFWPLFWLSVYLFDFMNVVMGLMDEDHEPGYPMKITGEYLTEEEIAEYLKNLE